MATIPNIFEDLTAAGDAELTGTEFDDIITGGIGNNVIEGGGGDDFVFGRDGNDEITVEDGNDTVFGELGDDLIFLGDAASGAAREDGTNPSNYGYGGEGNDTIFGGNDTDYIYGELGDDILDGGRGDDVILGDDTTDPLLGGADTITGGFGSDFLSGGLGADIINSHTSRAVVGTTRLLERDEIYAGRDTDSDTINLFTNYAGGRTSSRPARARSFGDNSLAIIDQFNPTNDFLNLRERPIAYRLVQGNYDGDRVNDTFITQGNNTVAVVLDVSRSALGAVLGQVS